jgi:dCMP deaminase
MRATRDETYMKIAEAMAGRTTCCRRAVGGVAVDKDGIVLATAYNGVPRGFNHCNEGFPCSGADSPSGTNLDGCEALHCETNLMLHIPDVKKVDTIYLTTSPCFNCTKTLLGTSAEKIIFRDEYPGSEKCQALWTRMGRIWKQYGA